MSSLNDGVAKALEDQSPIRIFLDPLTSLFDSTDYRRSVDQFVQNQVRDILQSSTPNNKPLLRLLVIEIWGKRTFIVVDVNHHAYDSHTAHDPSKNNLVVYRIKVRRDGGCVMISRDTRLDRRVNERVADLHRLNGVNASPPYLADHSPGADPIQYTSPRPLSFSSTNK
ncbi:hypothetical protein G7Y89_g5432 [Cudoniella acicularis]|uniref:Uncharacterized protein n=1 Tax=Cudoniella acicularis TaxID=354080 RepID=A0A8H4RPP0_9HELO|nr:hypothetical protein G7Y89_g5432 [Cudoniella acicularis]